MNGVSGREVDGRTELADDTDVADGNQFEPSPWGKDAPRWRFFFFSYQGLSTGWCLSVAAYIVQARNMEIV